MSTPNIETSLKTDLDAGRPTEMKDQIFNVIDMGQSHGLDMPAHRRVAGKFCYRG